MQEPVKNPEEEPEKSENRQNNLHAHSQAKEYIWGKDHKHNKSEAEEKQVRNPRGGSCGWRNAPLGHMETKELFRWSVVCSIRLVARRCPAKAEKAPKRCASFVLLALWKGDPPRGKTALRL